GLLLWRKSRDEEKKRQMPGVTDLDEQRVLKRDELVRDLKNVPCRLKLLITDACYEPVNIRLDFYGGPSIDRDPSDPPPPPPDEQFTEFPPVPESTQDRILTDLFLNHRGLLDLNSAKKDQLA